MCSGGAEHEAWSFGCGATQWHSVAGCALQVHLISLCSGSTFKVRWTPVLAYGMRASSPGQQATLLAAAAAAASRLPPGRKHPLHSQGWTAGAHDPAGATGCAASSRLIGRLISRPLVALCRHCPSTSAAGRRRPFAALRDSTDAAPNGAARGIEDPQVPNAQFGSLVCRGMDAIAAAPVDKAAAGAGNPRRHQGIPHLKKPHEESACMPSMPDQTAQVCAREREARSAGHVLS